MERKETKALCHCWGMGGKRTPQTWLWRWTSDPIKPERLINNLLSPHLSGSDARLYSGIWADRPQPYFSELNWNGRVRLSLASFSFLDRWRLKVKWVVGSTCRYKGCCHSAPSLESLTPPPTSSVFIFGRPQLFPCSGPGALRYLEYVRIWVGLGS